MLARLGQGDGRALPSGAARTPDAVHVRLGVRRQIVVDDVRDVPDVEPARRHVGGDEQVGRGRSDALHDRVALALLHAAVQCLGAVAMGVQRLDERIHLQPRPAEDDRGRRALHVENAVERGCFVAMTDDVGDLADPGNRARRLFPGDRDASRGFEVTLGDLQDPGGQRRREQRRLPRVRCFLQDGVEILGKAHVEHFVGLVEHQHPNGVEEERPAPDVVQRPARRGDDDVRASIERAELLLHRGAAVERHRAEPGAAGVLVNRLAHLHRQLARGHEHEARGASGRDGFLPARLPGRPFSLAFHLRGHRQTLNHRQREGGCLAGAGFGLRQQVAAREDQGNRLALDRRRLFVAERRNHGDEWVRQPER